jgi:hypothetical protein
MIWFPACPLRSSSGNFAIFTAILLIAGERLSRRTGIVKIDLGEFLTVAVADAKAGVSFLDRPRRREAAMRH